MLTGPGYGVLVSHTTGINSSFSTAHALGGCGEQFPHPTSPRLPYFPAYFLGRGQAPPAIASSSSIASGSKSGQLGHSLGNDDDHLSMPRAISSSVSKHSSRRAVSAALSSPLPIKTSSCRRSPYSPSKSASIAARKSGGISLRSCVANHGSAGWMLRRAPAWPHVSETYSAQGPHASQMYPLDRSTEPKASRARASTSARFALISSGSSPSPASRMPSALPPAASAPSPSSPSSSPPGSGNDRIKCVSRNS
mmetsp:Transcript_10739/g.27632  ORF Transcript_10739/g.27632 Transcript_10739/m.27632 type:complete len:252 (-) Transcript_10739:673-1428(-)